MITNIILFAHPHTFIELYTTIKKDDHKLKVNIQWHFDEMTSQMLIMDFDQNKNFKLDSEDIKLIKKEAFDHLVEYNYYTYLIAKDKVLNKQPQNFKAYIKNDKVVYDFNYILNSKLLNHNFNIEFKDKDFFIAFILKKDKIKVDKDIKYKLIEIDNEYYFAYKLEMN
jgi:ABC-type uncharacterized transport system substrate-binding protein